MSTQKARETAAEKAPGSAERSEATLLVSCPDRPGLVASIAQLLCDAGANILESDQHTDLEAGHFFQRVRFELSRGPGDLEPRLAKMAERYLMHWRLHDATRSKRLAIFVSKTDHCLYDLLLRHRSGELACEIPLVVSNHETLRGIAEHFGIPFAVYAITKQNKSEQEKKEIALLEEHEVDLIVMARYMQILSGSFVDRFPSQIINIHHSFLPAFMGGRPYHQAHERGVKLVGATAHYATRDLDEGPIIEQDVIRVSHRDATPELVRRGRDVERSVLSRAVRWHLEDRVLLWGNRTVVFG